MTLTGGIDPDTGHPLTERRIVHMALECLVYPGEAQDTILDGAKTAIQTGYRMIAALDADLQDLDEIIRLVDDQGIDVLPGEGRVRLMNVRTWLGRRVQRHRFRLCELERTT